MAEKKTTKTDLYEVKVRLFRGKKTYDENGNFNSENHVMNAPEYPSLEFDAFVKNVKNLYTAVKFESIKRFVKTSEEINDEVVVTRSVIDEVPADVEKKVNEIVSGIYKVADKALTPEQKEIAELKAKNAEMEAKMDAILSGNTATTSAPVNEANNEDEDAEPSLEDLQAEYEDLTGKPPHGLWKERRLTEEISKLK